MKLRVADGAVLRRGLARAGVRLGKATRQEDTFFVGPGGRKADEAIRQRHAGKTWELTYKGPRDATSKRAGVKARQEVTVKLGGDATELLGCMGYQPSLRMVKTRAKGKHGAVAVAVDHVQGLGSFVELEVVCAPSQVAAARKRIEKAIGELGIKGRRVQKSYAEMLAD